MCYTIVAVKETKHRELNRNKDFPRVSVVSIATGYGLDD
jgi:hypothetical protein